MIIACLPARCPARGQRSDSSPSPVPSAAHEVLPGSVLRCPAYCLLAAVPRHHGHQRQTVALGQMVGEEAHGEGRVIGYQSIESTITNGKRCTCRGRRRQAGKGVVTSHTFVGRQRRGRAVNMAGSHASAGERNARGQCGSSVCSGQGDHRRLSFGSISERVNSTGGASCMQTTARFNPRNVLRGAGVIKDLPTSELRWQAWARATRRRAVQRPVGLHAERHWPKALRGR